MSSWISFARCLAQGRIGVLMVWIRAGVCAQGVGVESKTFLTDVPEGPVGLGWPTPDADAPPVPPWWPPPLPPPAPLPLPPPHFGPLAGERPEICGVEMRLRMPTGVDRAHQADVATGLRTHGWHEATRWPPTGVATPHHPDDEEDGTRGFIILAGRAGTPLGETRVGRGSEEDEAHFCGDDASTEYCSAAGDAPWCALA